MPSKVNPLARPLRNGGPKAVAYAALAKVEARRDDALLMRSEGGGESRPSSISDADRYPSFCRLAASNDRVFRRFRRSPTYMTILEHVSRKQGASYLAEARRSGLSLEPCLSVLQNDTIGRPRRWTYPGLGAVSPTTLRYVKVWSDLRSLFGPLSNLEIAEIGVGYGGQYRVLAATEAVLRYHMFDLPEALSLAFRFLSATGTDQSVVRAHDGRAPDEAAADLLISNYAFSELNRDFQEIYFERVIRNARRGYVTYNQIAPAEFRSLSAEEFAARIRGARLLDERPLTSPANVIVVWGD